MLIIENTTISAENTSNSADTAQAQATPVTVETTETVAPKAKAAKKPKQSKPAKATVAAKAVAKPVTAKPADTAKREAEATKRAEIISDARSFVSTFYNGPSLTVHSRKPAKLADYAARVQSPIQRCADGNPTTRDESLLALVLSESNSKTFSFDPVKLALDCGGLSRLASIGAVAYDAGNGFTVTESGRTRARALLKRSAKPASTTPNA